MGRAYVYKPIRRGDTPEVAETKRQVAEAEVKTPEQMTVRELKAELNERGIEFGATALKADLVALLEDKQADDA